MRKIILILILIMSFPVFALAVPGYPTKAYVVNQTISASPSYIYSVNIPTGASNITIQSRQATPFTTVFADSNNPTPNTSAYYTIKSGTVFTVNQTSAQGLSLYFKSSTATPQDIEISYWQ